MLAPNHVSAPAVVHTSSIPPKLGSARLTSDGCTKIEEPTMVPTTIAVACTRPIERAKSTFKFSEQATKGALRVEIYSRRRNRAHGQAADTAGLKACTTALSYDRM